MWEKSRIELQIPKKFVELIDEIAELTGATRSDFIRRSIEHYICALKESSMLSTLGRDLTTNGR